MKIYEFSSQHLYHVNDDHVVCRMDYLNKQDLVNYLGSQFCMADLFGGDDNDPTADEYIKLADKVKKDGSKFITTVKLSDGSNMFGVHV